MWKKLLMMLGVAFMLGTGVGCASQIAVRSSAPSGMTVRADTLRIYQDARAGFALDYPGGWVLQDLDAASKQTAEGYSVSLGSWEGYGKGGQPIPAGETKIDIEVTSLKGMTAVQALAARAAEIEQGMPSGSIQSREPWTLANNLPAERWHVKTDYEEIDVLIAGTQGYAVTLFGIGDGQAFDAIAHSLHTLP